MVIRSAPNREADATSLRTAEGSRHALPHTVGRMVLLYLASGDCIELESAVEAETQGSFLVCVDRFGSDLTRFRLREVTAFTSQEVEWSA